MHTVFGGGARERLDLAVARVQRSKSHLQRRLQGARRRVVHSTGGHRVRQGCRRRRSNRRPAGSGTGVHGPQHGLQSAGGNRYLREGAHRGIGGVGQIGIGADLLGQRIRRQLPVSGDRQRQLLRDALGGTRVAERDADRRRPRVQAGAGRGERAARGHQEPNRHGVHER